MKRIVTGALALFLYGCSSEIESIHPETASITSSVYASGVVKGKNQYQAFASVSGIIEEVLVDEGDTVTIGTPIVKISNEAQRLNKENAALAASFSDFNANQGKLNDAKSQLDVATLKLRNDSVLFFRQKKLWEQNIGSKLELEQRELNYANSKAGFNSAKLRYDDLKRQLSFNAQQSQKNLMISSTLENDFVLKSKINGIVYSLAKLKGELVGPQTPIAVIGDAGDFVLEMQVDEFDIIRIKNGLTVLITLDSYKDKVYEAKITKINPLMNERSKTFTVEASFIEKPPVIYPNISFEANIVLEKKDKALLIPRDYLINDSLVQKDNGEQVVVKIGLMDFQKVEILSGITANDRLVKPSK